MKKTIALAALLAAAGCGEVTQAEPGPRDEFRFPTGVGVASGKLLVASSNFDLRYDSDTGGSLVSVEPEAGDALRGGINIRSFAGELAVADGSACGLAESLALVPVRGSGNFLYRVTVAADGSLSCGPGCEIPLTGAGFADPFVMGVACSPGIARAFVGYLRSSTGNTWITQVDLTVDLADPDRLPEALQHRIGGPGRIRDFAYEADRERLWVVGGTDGIRAPLRWIDLSEGCRFDGVPSIDACATGAVEAPTLPDGLELRSVALSHEAAPLRRAYLTARRYDPAAALLLGINAPDLGGVLLVADLVDGPAGRIELRVVNSFEIGRGASKVRVLPPRAGRRDVVVALAADEGVVWVYDDETGDRTLVGRDATSGAPAVGHSPFGLAVDPVPLAGDVGRVYVGSFLDGWVTPVDVPLDAPGSASIPRVGDDYRRIRRGTP